MLKTENSTFRDNMHIYIRIIAILAFLTQRARVRELANRKVRARERAFSGLNGIVGFQ